MINFLIGSHRLLVNLCRCHSLRTLQIFAWLPKVSSSLGSRNLSLHQTDLIMTKYLRFGQERKSNLVLGISLASMVIILEHEKIILPRMSALR